MAKIVESIDISRRPGDVFAYAADFSHFPEWQGGVVSVRREGTGNPAWPGHGLRQDCAHRLPQCHFGRACPIFSWRASRAATAITSRSRYGTRSSRPCAMVIRSALTRMSPANQVLTLTYLLASRATNHSGTAAASATGLRTRVPPVTVMAWS